MSASPTKRARTEEPCDEKHTIDVTKSATDSITQDGSLMWSTGLRWSAAPLPPVTGIPKGMIDARGCVVIHCAAEEGDGTEWYVVPLAKFNEDIAPIAKRNDFKGESMIEYVMGVDPCTPDGYGSFRCRPGCPPPSRSEGDMMHRQFEKWQNELGKDKFFVQRIAHMFGPVCIISVDIHE